MINERVKKLKNDYLSATPQVCAERSRLFTEYFRQSEGEPIVLRRANAFRHVLQKMTIVIHEPELIVGSQTKYIRGSSVYLEDSCDWVQKEINQFSQREMQKKNISEYDRNLLLEDAEYWKGKSVKDRVSILWHEKWGKKIEECDEARVFLLDQQGSHGGRVAADYPKVLTKGLSGIIEEVRELLQELTVHSYEDLRKKFFLEAVIISFQGVIDFAKRYAALARELPRSGVSPARKTELEHIADICEWVPANPARTFHEALQSFWFTHLAIEIENCTSGYTPGRFDQYMYPFYRQDISNEKLTREKAAELLGCLWLKFTQIERCTSHSLSKVVADSMYQNITIGGQTPEGHDATNELSYLILDVTKSLKVIQPTISLRYFDGLTDDFLHKAVDVVRSGGGMPAWFGDKNAITSLVSHNVPLAEARGYSPVGCVDKGIPGATADLLGAGVVNMAKCVELALNDGRDPLTKKQIGPKTGDPREFNSFDDLTEAFREQLRYFLDMAISCQLMRYALHPDLVPLPFTSGLVNDCIRRGKGIDQGGVRWRKLFAASPFGMVNTANSLVAIRKVVYEDNALSINKLLEALQADFEGYEDIRQMLWKVTKYGNDDDDADLMVNELYQMAIDIISQYKNPWSDPLASMFGGVTFHYYFGSTTGALPDGRKARTPLADATLSAFPSTDLHGPTAVIKSATKIDTIRSLGTILNLKFTPQVLKSTYDLRKFLSLIKTYFDLGGWHIQFNVVDRKTLIEAQKKPDEYRDLLIRVAGFSMFWVDLAPEIQNEIIARTEHSL